MGWRVGSRGILIVAAAMVSTPGWAYYHFTHYTRTSSPFAPIQEKFDLNALPNKTLSFYISDNGPTQLLPNDSNASVLGAFRQAIQAWDAVGTSDLRLSFGGLYTQNAPSNTPNVQILFSDDIPPGVIEQAGPISKLTSNGQFVPITASVIMVHRNLTDGASSTEDFFTTAVHEIGHAIGLQHTWTSSAMSTATTRSTTRAKAIDSDDIAGITLLYPKAGALAQFGSITGRVLSGGQPVHLASVVALRPTGSAVSTLTQPDGTYRIDGLPPDTYWVYVHPLPPAVQSSLGPGDIVLPVNPNNQSVAGTGATETLFYPGTRDPNSFIPIQVRSGSTVSLADMSLARKSSPAIYGVTTYGYYGSVASSPAYMNANTTGGSIVATGAGLISSGVSPTSGLGVVALGGVGTLPQSSTTPVNIRPYTPSYITLDLLLPPFAGTGPRHLLFTVPGDAYVLPNGLNLVQKQPPAINGVNTQPDGSVAITGTSLAADSRAFFDSLPAITRSFSGNDQSGTLVVVPPVGFSGQVSAVEVYNSDGQNSAFVVPTPPTYSYNFSSTPGFSLNSPTNALPAGTSALIDISGVNTQFVDGQTTLGIGTSDVTVRRVWVLSPTHAWADVLVSPNASAGQYTASVITGFQVAEQLFSFQVIPLGATTGLNRPSLVTWPANLNPSQTSIFPGASVVLTGTNLSTGAGITLTLTTPSGNSQPVTIQSASPNQLIFQVPSNFPTGPAQLNLNNGSADAYPIAIQIDGAPAVITSVLSSVNQTVDGSHPDAAGDIVGVLLQNLDPTTVNNPGRVHLVEGTTDLTALSVAPAAGQPGLYEAWFTLSPALTSQLVQLVVTVDGVASNAVIIAIR